ncbi:MAG TPA: alpha/beta hydrolase [Vicinamibacterales bacterium]|nr:alpha/beta hydrolase [Vicinamibacterales bacterium]
MKKILSKDGTAIAVERVGSGPALVFVDGAMCYRASGPSQSMATALAGHFTVFTYDRRGRGESSDSGPYDIQREVDDLDAVIREAGGQALVLGVSSGAALALEAANRGVPITRLALYEAPFIVDDTRPAVSDEFVPQLNAALAGGRRADAVKMFMKLVGVPSIFIMLMRVMPAWPKLTAVAHTLAYDLTIVEPYQKGRPLPVTRWSRATMPTLVMDGGKTPAWMRNATRALAGVLPNATYRTLDGQTHMIKPKALAPPLVEFFRKNAPTPV